MGNARGTPAQLERTARKQPWHVLGVKENATAAEVKVAYRKLARQFHPDIYQAPPEAQGVDGTALFQALETANSRFNSSDGTWRCDTFEQAAPSTDRPGYTPPPSAPAMDPKVVAEFGRAGVHASNVQWYLQNGLTARDVPSFLKAGIREPARMAWMVQQRVPGSLALAFTQANVRDPRGMATLVQAGLGPRDVTVFQRLGVEDPTHMAGWASRGINGDVAHSYATSGVTSLPQMADWRAQGITPELAARYLRVGLRTVEETTYAHTNGLTPVMISGYHQRGIQDLAQMIAWEEQRRGTSQWWS